MKSLLIKDTTEKERGKIIKDSLGVIDGLCDGCAVGVTSMYDDYIKGRKELKDINASFRSEYSADKKDR